MLRWFRQRFFGPPAPETFARQVIERLHRAGDRRTAHYDVEQFAIRFFDADKEAGILNLRNFYAEYAHLPRASREAWWSRVVRGAFVHLKEIPDEFEHARPDLRPLVRTRSYLESTSLQARIAGNQPLDNPYQPLGDHLMVCLGYDLPEAVSFINREQLDGWGVTFYEAQEAAVGNLSEIPYQVARLGEGLFVFLTGDTYDGSRLLLVDRLRSFPVQGDLVAMVVNRDTLLVAGSDDAEGLGAMVGLAIEKLKEPRPLCPVPIRLAAGDDWQSWLPPPDHPHFAAFKRLELQYMFDEYDDQKQLLEKLHEQQGIDEFVASYSAVEKDGLAFSYCLWIKDIATQLPRADRVLFTASESEPPLWVAWDRAIKIAGGLMRELDVYPPRWFVDAFPTPEQLADMGAQPL